MNEEFEFGPLIRNKCVDASSALINNESFRGYVEYISSELKKGKKPLIIVGAGISSSRTHCSDDKETKEGLPTLILMIKHILKLVAELFNAELPNAELRELSHLFTDDIKNDLKKDDENYSAIDREWLSKLFTTLSFSTSPSVKKIWSDFCNWFLFECIKFPDDEKKGAMTTLSSAAAKEISLFSKTADAFCLSANFDNYLTYQKKTSTGKESAVPAISIFKKGTAKKYFIRTRRHRKKDGKELRFEEADENECVLHTNGDVLWLSCSGDKVDGYCPETGKYFPAFNRDKYKKREDLRCDICGSELTPTMTMPGTYKKDHDTREILAAVWKYVASKISTVITIGISCNWDDVILKFIIELLFENNIPHLDINTNPEKTEIYKKIISDNYFNSVALKQDAADGTKWLYDLFLNAKKDEKNEDPFDKSRQQHIKDILAKTETIQNLKLISQVGLKSYWIPSIEGKNDRWSHSQEVADNALMFYEQLHKNSHKVEKQEEEALVYISGLLHDCGHLPFSHLLEEVFSELSWKIFGNTESFTHNQYTAERIKEMYDDEKSGLKALLNSYNITCEEVIKVIQGKYGIGYIDALINSEIDCDKISYLVKDARHMGFGTTLTDDIIKSLSKNAFITQEGLVALDSESAWHAFRLLDERTRFYKELYFRDDIRCLEAAVKFIIITYFVQKYNVLEESAYEDYRDDEYDNFGHCRVMMAIRDLFAIIDDKANKKDDESLEYSLSGQVKESIKRCMDIIMKSNYGSDVSPENNDKQPNEIKILKKFYLRLTGEDYKPDGTKNEDIISRPYIDDDILELSSRLSYKVLKEIRKRMHLNFPGVLLIDVYKPVNYLSSAEDRRKRVRLDGTEESQTVFLVPDSDRTKWGNTNALAGIDIADYVKKQNIGQDKPAFNVFKISRNTTETEHALNMLKKEMKRRLEETHNGN
jgi:HD superfamily phosphohydrolase